MEKDQLELEVATQKGLAKKAKEKAERAIATARVAMEAAATRAKTDGAKIEELEKQLMEARRTSNEETTTTRDDYEKENDNDDNVTADKDANVDELKIRIEKLESHCVDASAAAKNAADALDTANEELALERKKCSSLEREMLTLSNDFAILTEAFEKSQTELTMRDENLAALAKELELSLALNSNEDATTSWEKDGVVNALWNSAVILLATFNDLTPSRTIGFLNFFFFFFGFIVIVFLASHIFSSSPLKLPPRRMAIMVKMVL
jgi:chromosome segregation ATPase